MKLNELKLFVDSYLSDTLYRLDAGIECARYDEAKETVVIYFVNGNTREVNVAGDSKLAIMADVTKSLWGGEKR